MIEQLLFTEKKPRHM